MQTSLCNIFRFLLVVISQDFYNHVAAAYFWVGAWWTQNHNKKVFPNSIPRYLSYTYFICAFARKFVVQNDSYITSVENDNCIQNKVGLENRFNSIFTLIVNYGTVIRVLYIYMFRESGFLHFAQVENIINR